LASLPVTLADDSTIVCGRPRHCPFAAATLN
jgi:hypothetical protein